MTASRVRVGALTAAALLTVLGAAAFPGTRPMLSRAARHFGLTAAPPAAAAGRPLHTMTLASLTGSPVSLENAPGRALVINVFTSWCPSCNDEMPAISQAAPRLAKAGIDVVGVDQAESPAQVERFVAAYHLKYPVYIDGDASSRSLLGARVIPTTIVVDANGVVRYVHVGPLDESEFLAMALTVKSE